MRRTGQPNPDALQLRSAATYLVTGGLGSLGLEIAGYLAAHGARHVVLTSRRAPGAVVQQRIEALLEQHGCAVRVIAADVADHDGISPLEATALDEIAEALGVDKAALLEASPIKRSIG